ncbi:hypothetical protein CEP45_01915 [Mergibacter septicus]|uniref:alpha/beta fold hydrolase n=1 Tax=Mergibacter septicus TaxID=221402 RepID=UPI001C78B2C6|nr:alpha/beta fold hydrolase [Mergibacter septicus]QDJ12671.1 hypothetical protein CEP45_01915 [Mergibacter septicus]
MKKHLNFDYSQRDESSEPTLVFIHGLFGDMNNLGGIAKAFADNYSLLRIDLRNHGSSFHSDEMNYSVMAEDLLILIQTLNLHKVILIGHSMGGKTAMVFADRYPEYVAGLVVIDIAPVSYHAHRHHDVFQGLFAVQKSQVATRQQAKTEMAKYINDESVQQFLLKSFTTQSPQHFRFNTQVLFQHYADIMDWQPVKVNLPTLFIKGGNSDYILPEYRNVIMEQFPHATAFVIAGAEHWVHAEKPASVIQAISKFLSKIRNFEGK